MGSMSEEKGLPPEQISSLVGNSGTRRALRMDSP